MAESCVRVPREGVCARSGGSFPPPARRRGWRDSQGDLRKGPSKEILPAAADGRVRRRSAAHRLPGPARQLPSRRRRARSRPAAPGQVGHSEAARRRQRVRRRARLPSDRRNPRSAVHARRRRPLPRRPHGGTRLSRLAAATARPARPPRAAPRTEPSDLALALVPCDRPGGSDLVELSPRGKVRRIEIKPESTTLKWTWAFALWTPRFTRFLLKWTEGYNARSLRLGREPHAADVCSPRRWPRRSRSPLSPCREARLLDIGTPETLEQARGTR